MKRLAIVLSSLVWLTTACAPAMAQRNVISDLPTETPTILPTFTVPTAIPTQTPEPTIMPTITLTLDPIRSTPPTIVLHRPSNVFDSVTFLKDLIVILKQNNVKVITYQDIYKNPSKTATEKGHLFIITIDDIYLRYPMHSTIKEMISILKEAGYPAVLGVVTESNYIDPETANTLKELSDAGWEIASHTDTHANLGLLEKRSSRLVMNEITISMDKIEKVTGIRPNTLILPEGQMVNHVEYIYNAGIYWVVGINGGILYDSRKNIIYVGRESPDGTAEKTFKYMKIRFGF